MLEHADNTNVIIATSNDPAILRGKVKRFVVAFLGMIFDYIDRVCLKLCRFLLSKQLQYTMIRQPVTLPKAQKVVTVRRRLIRLACYWPTWVFFLLLAKGQPSSNKSRQRRLGT